jgi:hypothetical protein
MLLPDGSRVYVVDEQDDNVRMRWQVGQIRVECRGVGSPNARKNHRCQHAHYHGCSSRLVSSCYRVGAVGDRRVEIPCTDRTTDCCLVQLATVNVEEVAVNRHNLFVQKAHAPAMSMGTVSVIYANDLPKEAVARVEAGWCASGR